MPWKQCYLLQRVGTYIYSRIIDNLSSNIYSRCRYIWLCYIIHWIRIILGLRFLFILRLWLILGLRLWLVQLFRFWFILGLSLIMGLSLELFLTFSFLHAKREK